MEKKEDFVLRNNDGEVSPVVGASVTVNIYGGGLATLYEDNESTTKANPLTTDDAGKFSFKAVDGTYVLTITHASITTISVGPFILEDPADGSDLAYLPGGVGAVATTVQAQLRQTMSLTDHMTAAQRADVAAGTFLLDVTTACQSVLDAAKLGAKRVFIPAGRYLISQISLPGGIELFGPAIGHYGASVANDVSVFVQKDGVNKDAIVFDASFDGTYYRIDPGYYHDFVVKKVASPTDTTGNGISMQDGAGNHAMPNGDFIMARIQIRGFPENGLYCKQGGTPIFLDTIDTLFNGGYGVRIDGEQNAANIVLKDIAGDGNKAGATIKIGSLVTNANFFIYNTYAEYVNSNPYGVTSGFSAAQPYAIEISDFGANGTVLIHGINGNSAYSTEAIDAAIFLNVADAAKKPFITWRGVSIKRSGYAGGNAYMLKDAISSITVPYQCVDGCYTNNRYFGVNIASGRHGFGIAAPAAIAHSHVNTLSASRANANWYGTRDHTSGYFSVQFLTGSSVGDWFEYSDASATSFGTETNKPLDLYTNNVFRYRVDTSGNMTPGADATQNFGSTTKRAAIVYTMKLGVGLGTAPTALVHLAAGTATANTGPLKFTAGTLLTSPEDGVIEFDGTDWYRTAGAVRSKDGEFVTATVASGSAVSLTTATAANVTSISLTAGDWDLRGQVDFTLGAATATLHEAGISLTTATLPTQAGGSGLGTDPLVVNPYPTTTLTGTIDMEVSGVRLSIAATTTVYLVAKATFSVGTEAAYGTISARRMK